MSEVEIWTKWTRTSSHSDFSSAHYKVIFHKTFWRKTSLSTDVLCTVTFRWCWSTAWAEWQMQRINLLVSNPQLCLLLFVSV